MSSSQRALFFSREERQELQEVLADRDRADRKYRGGKKFGRSGDEGLGFLGAHRGSTPWAEDGDAPPLQMAEYADDIQPFVEDRYQSKSGDEYDLNSLPY